MLNKITIQGRLTKDPELRYTQNQIPVASFFLAVERDFKEQDGNRGVDFVNCVAWRNAADFVSKYFYKGDMCIVAGRLQSRTYTDKGGNSRQAWEVVVDNAYFGGAKAKRDQEAGQPTASEPAGNGWKTAGGPVNVGFDEELDGELPF